MKHLSIQKVVIPEKRPQSLNNWIAYHIHVNKTLVSGKYKCNQYIPKW